MRDPAGTGMVEADVTINGIVLSFAESLTVRVALSSFLAYVNEPANASALGAIADGYSRVLMGLIQIIHDPIIANIERRRRDRNFTPGPRRGR